MDLSGRHIFLAGATGMVGSAIIDQILRDYSDTRVRAAYFSTDPWIVDERVEYVRIDLRDRDNCREAIEGCDLAIMAAATTAGAGSHKKEPWRQVNDNLTMNANMFEAFHLSKIQRVVFISSASLYQEFEGSVSEEDLDLNRDPHPSHFGVGWVFRSLEKLCQFWHMHAGMEISIVRAANIYGPYARFDPETSNFIPAIIRKAVDQMDPFEVWGSPDVARDVIYSDDFAKAILAMLNYKEATFDIFNIGSGTSVTVGEIVELALKTTEHKPSRIIYDESKPETIRSRILDCAKAKNNLGWEPQYSAREGINMTVKWWENNRSRWKR